MKKIMVALLPIFMILIQVNSATTYGVSNRNENVSSSMQKNNNTVSGKKVAKKIKSNITTLDFSDNGKEALKWSNKNFPTILNEDIMLIKSINNQLRNKFMNRSELYQPFKDLESIDNGFITQTSDDTVLYANLTPEEFGIHSKYFLDNSEKVYDSMLKESLFGIDHGYFIGDLEKKELEQSKNEYIQISLVLPKGSKLMRVGNITESKYIIPRDSTLSYVGKNFNKESKIVTISAEVIDRSMLDKATKKQETVINNTMRTVYGTPNNFIALTPLGLNAGYVLADSLNVVSKSFEMLHSGGILSKTFFNKQTFNLTSGWIVHTSIFDRWSEDHTLEQRQELFEENFDTNSLGVTQIWDDKTCESVINFSNFGDEDKLVQLSKSEELAGTLLHETFHYLIHSTNFFEDRPLFKGDPEIFKDMINFLKEEDEGKLVDLLNDDYAEEDWEEFICEAFMAKFHPNKDISMTFKKDIPQTNRMLDNVFDFDPPTIPKNLKELEIGGHSVKLTFDHSTDNIGVDMYNIYQNGKVVKTEITEKDDDYLSYPNPGDHQPRLEILIDNLEQITDYEFQVTAVDDAQNESAKSNILKIKTKDTEPPELTGPLTGQPLVSSVARFNWPHPTDNDHVKEVKLYRNESSSMLRNPISKAEKTFTIPANENYYTDTTIEKGKAYTYYMVAIDESGNVSEKSNQVVIKTNEQDDKRKNEDKAENISSSNATLNWTGAFEGLSPAGFQIFSFSKGIGGWLFGGVTSVAGSVQSQIMNLKPDSEYQFVIIPVDHKDNPLHEGLPISVVTPAVPKITANVMEQTIPLGTNAKGINYTNFVSHVKVGDRALSSEEYTVTTKEAIKTEIVGKVKVPVRVSVIADPSNFIDLEVPVEISWGNSLHMRSSSPYSIFTLSLFKQGEQLMLVPAKGETVPSGKIHNTINGKYFGIDVYTVGDLNEGDNLDNIYTQSIDSNKDRTTAYKDIVPVKVEEENVLKIYHRHSRTIPNLQELYLEGEKSIPNSDKHMVNNELFLEMTENGFNILNFNQLTPKSNNIYTNMTDQELDRNIGDYLDLKGFRNLSIKKFSNYPDRSKIGKSEGKIIVEEVLSKGRIVQYEYRVPFNIETPPKGGDIIVNHISNGEEIAPSEIVTGRIGDRIDLLPMYVECYFPVIEDESKAVIVKEESQTVTFSYDTMFFAMNKFTDKYLSEHMAPEVASVIERGLANQNNKLGYLIDDTLEIYAPIGGVSITIPENNPIGLNKYFKTWGSFPPPMWLKSRSFSFSHYNGGLTITRNENRDLPDENDFEVRSAFNYFLEQWDPRKSEWIKHNELRHMPGEGRHYINFGDHIEKAPKFELKLKDETLTVKKGSQFTYKPEDFFEEISSAGGIRSVFVEIPDLSQVGIKTAKIRVWDQYVIRYGWDFLKTEEDWKRFESRLNKQHYITFEVLFNVVD